MNSFSSCISLPLAPRPLLVLPFLTALALPIACGGRGTSSDGSSGDGSSDGTSTDGTSTDGSSADGTDALPGADNPTWTDETHTADAELDFATVFPDDRVLRFDIAITADDWAAMQADLVANMGGTSGPGGMPGGGVPMDTGTDFDPMWAEATVEFDGATWEHVGIRYKGNSSLQDAYSSGTNGKYPYKLDFDEWEDTYPAIDDQRFFGFKQLNLSSNYKDDSFMHEKLAVEAFREFNVVAAHAAFAEVYIDKGDGSGPQFAGIYTLIEEVDDTVVETQFDDTDGNLYKPEDSGATFAEGTFSTAEMYAKTNEDTTDYADVQALYDALHAADTGSATWQANLETVFSVSDFLEYLAVNQVIQNWDTYGVMNHNFFLYNRDGALEWIPWDNNESFDSSGRGLLSLGLDEVGSDWPLLSYLMDVAAYKSEYEANMASFLAGPFAEDAMHARIDAYETLLEPYAALETTQFASAVQSLRTHVTDRHSAVDSYLP